MGKITKIIIAILVLGGLVGGYFGIRYQLKLYNTIVQMNTKINLIDDFVSYTFPDETKLYIEALKSKTQTPVVLPANPTQK